MNKKSMWRVTAIHFQELYREKGFVTAFEYLQRLQYSSEDIEGMLSVVDEYAKPIYKE